MVQRWIPIESSFGVQSGSVASAHKSVIASFWGASAPVKARSHLSAADRFPVVDITERDFAFRASAESDEHVIAVECLPGQILHMTVGMLPEFTIRTASSSYQPKESSSPMCPSMLALVEVMMRL